MRIDVHTHAFHPKIAEKVIAQLAGHYGIAGVGNGLIEDLLERAAAAGLDRVVVHSAATDPSQVRPANDWAIFLQRSYPAVTSFGTIHPDCPDFEAELDRLAAAGIRGLKFHPEFQGFRMDDPRLGTILEACGGRFVLMFHVGDRLPPEQNPSCPFKLAAIRRAFPRTTMIAAHLGGYLHWKWALEALVGQDVYLDTSSSLPLLDDATVREIFRRHPREKILFGSDYPIFDPGTELERLRSRLALSDTEVEQILSSAAAIL